MTTPEDLERVRTYWEGSPLLAHEHPTADPIAHFSYLDEIKRTDVERFALHFWDFPAWRGRRVLDIGCGPGWLTVQYARAGALVTAVDLTQRAVDITRVALHHLGLDARVERGNAEELPFADGQFDLVVASGVLHHTPDTHKAMAEARRVCAHDGVGLITLYRRAWFHGRLIFPIVRRAMRWTRTRHPGANLAVEAKDADDFIRMYDGADNPVGRAMRDAEWQELFAAAGWNVRGREHHYFPARMVGRLRTPPLAPCTTQRAPRHDDLFQARTAAQVTRRAVNQRLPAYSRTTGTSSRVRTSLISG